MFRLVNFPTYRLTLPSAMDREAKYASKLFSKSPSCEPSTAKQPVIIAQFENGTLKSSGKSRLKFTSYQSTYNNSKRILVANSSRLSYAGFNFETNSSKVTSSVLKVCVLNKKNKTLRLHDADFFQLKPQIKCPEIINMKNDKSYVEKASELTLAFGSKMQQKRTNTKIKYGSGAANSSDALDSTLISFSDVTMEPNSVNIPKPSSVSSIIPPRNSSTMNIDEIYNIYDIISKEEFDLLDSEAQIFLDAKHDDIQLFKKENKYSDFIINFLESNVHSMNVHKAKLLCYLHFMFCFLRTGYADWKKKDPVPLVPQPFKQKIMDSYTMNKTLPMRLKDKLLAYSLVLGLKLNNYIINCNGFASATKMSVTKITAVANNLGCHVSGKKNNEAKIIQLKFPLYNPETKPKRKFK